MDDIGAPPELPVHPSVVPDSAAKARIRKNIDTMHAKGASDAEIETYLQDVEHLTPKTRAAPPTPSTGNIDLRTQRESTQVSPRADTGDAPLAQRMAETVVSGFPGAQRAVAGYRGLLSLIGGSGLSGAAHEVNSALDEQRKHVAKMPAVARLPMQVIGGAPAAALMAPLGAVGGAAAFGALEGADKAADGLADRAKNTALGGAIGGVSARVGQVLGSGIANVSDRTGLSDAVAKAIKKVNPDIAARMGTQGQVGKALTERQDILDAIDGGGQTAAQVQLARIAATKAKAGALYGAARRDTQVLDDPDLLKLLNDPQVKKAYQAAAEIRAASGNPLPREAAPPQVPLALQKMGVTPERYQHLQAVGRQRSRVPVLNGTDILPPELMGQPSSGVEMPDPDVLAKVKRYLYDAAKGRQDSPLAISQDEARALLPKVDEIRQHLHNLSPAWKEADAFYAHAKGQEEAFAHGFDAYRLSNNPSGEQLPTHSPEAMLAAIETPRYHGEPPDAMAARAQAFRDGVKAATAAQVRRAPVDRGAAAILKTKPLAPTPATAQTRSLMFDDPLDASDFEQLIGQKRGAVMEANGASSGFPTGRAGMLRSALQNVATPPDLIATQNGQRLLADNLRESVLSQTLDQFQQGASSSDYLKRLLGITAAAQVAR